MQLTFPNGEFANVSLDQGEVLVGSRSGNRVCLPSSGLSPVHGSFLVDRRGLWLTVPDGVVGVHVNARPVQTLALLRVGDLVCLDQVRMVIALAEGVEIDRQIPAATPPALTESQKVAAARVVLRGMSGPNFGRSFNLTESRVLGRATAADIRLDEADIAERHAMVELHGERVILRGLTADGSTLVNGIAVHDALLAPGDQIVIGQHRFLLEAPGLPPRGQPAYGKPPSTAHTQTLQKVRVPAAPVASIAETPSAPVKDPASLWWLIAAAAVLAASVTALVVYAPRLG